MAYPVAATLIASAPPPWGFNQPIYSAQLVGTALLLGVIVFLNWTREKAPPVVVARPLSVAEG
jgi:hypothetical protein